METEEDQAQNPVLCVPFGVFGVSWIFIGVGVLFIVVYWLFGLGYWWLIWCFSGKGLLVLWFY